MEIISEIKDLIKAKKLLRKTIKELKKIGKLADKKCKKLAKQIKKIPNNENVRLKDCVDGEWLR